MMLNSLRQLKCFSHLSNKQLDYLLKQSTQVCFNSREAIFVEGNRVENCYILIAGELELTKNLNGEQVILTVMQPGMLTTEIPLLADTVYMVTGRALSKSYLLRFQIDKFPKNLFQSFPITNFIFLLSLQIYKSCESYLGVVFHSPP